MNADRRSTVILFPGVMPIRKMTWGHEAVSNPEMRVFGQGQGSQTVGDKAAWISACAV